MDHLKRVVDEFTRQSETFDKWAAQADDQVAARFNAALGEAARGDLLDVACGPGVVTAAIAPVARSVIGFDATEQMLEKARSRCTLAKLTNITFQLGNAEHLPFVDAQFDGVVTRLAVHHFADPQLALDEMFRVLRPGGVAVIVDVVSSEDPAESSLQNAIERLRDPSHVRMLPASELDSRMARSGFRDMECATWDKSRAFEEWVNIANDPARAEPLRAIMQALAESGRTAGMGLSIRGNQIFFFHRWRLSRAVKAPGD